MKGEATCKECIFDNNKKCYDENGDCQMKAIETVLQTLKEVTEERDSIYKDYQALGKEFYNSIPKKKIEDKLKELEEIRTQSGNIYVDVLLAIKILQELLEK